MAHITYHSTCMAHTLDACGVMQGDAEWRADVGTSGTGALRVSHHHSCIFIIVPCLVRLCLSRIRVLLHPLLVASASYLQLVLERRAKLTPVIKELRAVRAEFAEAEGGYLHARAVYENTAAGLAAERATLEREAAAVQEDALREESRFASLHMSAEVLATQLERAREESSYEAGEGRYMRDFRTVKDLYAQKLGQLETLAKELRKKQKDIRENAGAHAAQRARFADLKRLLAAKAQLYKEDPTGGMAGGLGLGVGLPGAVAGGAGAAGLDRDLLGLDRAFGGAGAGLGGRGGGVAGAGGASGAASGVGFEDTGGAHVMTLEH